MKRYIKDKIELILRILLFVYRFFRYGRQYYFISVTGLQEDGVRMFGAGILRTDLGIVPLTSAMNKMKEKYGWQTCAIINFFKISRLQYRYFYREDFDVKFSYHFGKDPKKEQS
jgi:hypothetical protein